MAKLVLSAGDSVLYQCFVDKERLTVGRDSANPIVIDDPAVSREHAAIVPVGNDHILEDLASANGTYVNGKRVSRRILQHGDVIALGRFNLRYINLRTSSGVDLERTMLIEGLEREDADVQQHAADVHVPRARAPKVRLPNARVMVLRGSRSGSVIDLDRVVTMFGKRGRQLAVITRRPVGFFVTHVEGRRRTRVNGRPIGDEPRPLDHGDIVDVADEKLEFSLD
jgi:pSer/pThr/pTyr-binding forkhead associated (FHA) protein